MSQTIEMPQGVHGHQVAKRAMFLAYQKCGGTTGMGFLQANASADEDAVWQNVSCRGDYAPFGTGDGVTLSGDQISAYADYVFGRMMKLKIEATPTTVTVGDDRLGTDTSRCSPDPEYQGWSKDGTTYRGLILEAIQSLENQEETPTPETERFTEDYITVKSVKLDLDEGDVVIDLPDTFPRRPFNEDEDPLPVYTGDTKTILDHLVIEGHPVYGPMLQVPTEVLRALIQDDIQKLQECKAALAQMDAARAGSDGDPSAMLFLMIGQRLAEQARWERMMVTLHLLGLQISLAIHERDGIVEGTVEEFKASLREKAPGMLDQLVKKLDEIEERAHDDIVDNDELDQEAAERRETDEDAATAEEIALSQGILDEVIAEEQAEQVNKSN